MSCPFVWKRATLGVSLSASAELGLLDADYVEDYYGVDGQLTLVHLASGDEFVVSMVEVNDFDSISHDFFDGERDASVMPLGRYEVRGRVRDTLGRVVVLNRVDVMDGSEDIQEACFELVSHPVVDPDAVSDAPIRRQVFVAPRSGGARVGEDARIGRSVVVVSSIDPPLVAAGESNIFAAPPREANPVVSRAPLVIGPFTLSRSQVFVPAAVEA